MSDPSAAILPPHEPPRRLRLTRSLAGRLALAVFGSVALALAAATALSLWQEVHRYAEAKREALTTVAGIFATASGPAVDAGDAAAAARALNAIARRADLVYASIERLDGSILADRGLAIRLESDVDLDRGGSPLALLGSRTAQVQVPIVEAGRHVGSLVLVVDTTDLADRMLALLAASAWGSGLALALGLAVSYGLQRAITQPIAALAGTMDRVRTEQDYARSAHVVRDDEVGILAGSFNALLATVRERDHRLARHMERLENDVAARTADLHEAKEAAEAANTAKSTFLATMSHEIRTPLNGMLVMAEMLAGSDLPDRQKRHAEVIARSGQSLLAIINDILDFAKVEAGKIDLERIPLDPSETVDTVVALFAEKAREAGLDLAAYVAPDVPGRVMGDPVRLGQILSNFVNNALKFTKAGSVLVRLERGDAGHLRLSVRDTGVGIAADKVGTIFAAFSQADQSTTRRFGGTGLGLSIAHRLALAMGGRMGVDSTLGTGSTFWTELPLAAAGEALLLVGARRPEVEAHVVVALAGAATAESLRTRLAEAGFAPVAWNDSGAEAAHWIADATGLAALGRRPNASGRVLAAARLGDPAAETILAAGWADALLTLPIVQEEWTRALTALANGTPFAARERGAGADRTALAQFPAARVLVADDSAVNREVAREALARCGVTAITLVEDGQAALEACRDHAFDVVLMDGSMPVLDGYEAARAIRAEAAQTNRARVPIVALTAHVVGAAAEAWRAAGMDGTLTKPFTLAALAETLARFVTPAFTVSPELSASAAPIPRVPPADAADLLEADLPEADLLDADLLDADLLDAEVVGGLADMAARAGSDFAARIVGLYREHAPLALDELRRAAADAQADAVAQAAHSLKSMTLNIGGRTLAQALARIEAQARDAVQVPAPDTIERLAPLVQRTMDAVGARLDLGTASDPDGDSMPARCDCA